MRVYRRGGRPHPASGSDHAPGARWVLFNPGGGYTYTDAAVLLGRWQVDSLEWEMSAAIQGDPARSTSGMDEGTLGFLDGGRLLTVLRGSNSGRTELPGYRWFAHSTDGGRQWTKPQPWTYEGGEPFFSPSSCSQLLSHSSGRLIWLLGGDSLHSLNVETLRFVVEVFFLIELFALHLALLIVFLVWLARHVVHEFIGLRAAMKEWHST
ncbi:MAG TPA: sialidase family protein [Candidatus Acidoferrales bacterium]|nr:sialidase family protein [Candidatus Acidoferrales bacterium]